MFLLNMMIIYYYLDSSFQSLMNTNNQREREKNSLQKFTSQNVSNVVHTIQNLSVLRLKHFDLAKIIDES